MQDAANTSSTPVFTKGTDAQCLLEEMRQALSHQVSDLDRTRTDLDDWSNALFCDLEQMVACEREVTALEEKQLAQKATIHVVQEQQNIIRTELTHLEEHLQKEKAFQSEQVGGGNAQWSKEEVDKLYRDAECLSQAVSDLNNRLKDAVASANRSSAPQYEVTGGDNADPVASLMRGLNSQVALIRWAQQHSWDVSAQIDELEVRTRKKVC